VASNRYLTPNNETGTVCRSFNIPLALLPAFNGAVGDLFDPDSWELSGDMTPEECAQLLLECWENADEC
jgi:hypothetical protein